MKITDQRACDALALLFKEEFYKFNSDIRSGWSRFILSLVHRGPRDIEWIKQKTRDAFGKYSVNEIDSLSARVLIRVIDNKNIGERINEMRWSVVTVERPIHTILTSDMPVVMSDGIGYDDSYILMPISPLHIFVAVNTEKQENLIRGIPITMLISKINDRVTRQAQKYVYGIDDRQLRFVENRLGKTPLPLTPDTSPSLRFRRL